MIPLSSFISGKVRKKDFVITGLPETLFPIDWDSFEKALSLRRCPKCGLNLYQTFNRKMWRCKSTKNHKKPFIISDQKLSTYLKGK